MIRFVLLLQIGLLVYAGPLWAQAQRVVDIPTRPGVTQRMIVLMPETRTAAVVLLAGAHGGLQISPEGSMKWGDGNFVVRTRQMFAAGGLAVAVVDAPSDRQSPPYLTGFRQTPEHAADIKAVIAWLKKHTGVPVWLVGTSRGTQSAAYIATELPPSEGGPDGLVLTSTILTDERGSRPVPAMPLGKIRIPTLVVHHKRDGCKLSQYNDIPRMMDGLTASPRKEMIPFEGGQSNGDPCHSTAYHGFNGIEQQVVTRIVEWITAGAGKK